MTMGDEQPHLSKWSGPKDARIISQHLDAAFTAGPEAIIEAPLSSQDRNSMPTDNVAGKESSLKLEGGDIHRDLYKIEARARLHRRAQTFSHARQSVPDSTSTLAGADVRAPGAFRRQYMLQQRRFQSVTTPLTQNFVSFLDLYGSFYGEDLGESEDEEEADDVEATDAQPRQEADERRPLLGRRKSSRAAKKGDANLTKTFFLLLKSFIGTGVLFLPKAFKNGGLLFSTFTLVLVSLVTSVAFHLLLQCRVRYGGGYGEIGEAICGKKMRTVILASITFSQIGFVCAGIIFTAENLFSFLDTVVSGAAPLSVNALIGIQLLLLIPLSMIRNISKLGSAALLADVFILLGIVYIYQYDIAFLANHGINHTVRQFNSRDFTLTVGSAIFSFEGIGLILPIQSSMKEPEKFSKLLYFVMLLITVIFASVAGLSYATFGDSTNVELISNFPRNGLVNAVQFLYSLAILVGTPVQIFPAIRILEGSLFGHLSGKRDTATKWKKNAFRTAVVCLCGVVSALGAADLDKFVALIGSFACVPLVYIYPAYLHYQGIADSRPVKIGDVSLMALGFVAMVYTTTVTLLRWSEE